MRAQDKNHKEATMKRCIALALVAIVGLVTFTPEAFAHGGGCRKDSPAGKCCHMDRKKGEVHCH